MTARRVSIVVLCWNHWKLTKRCLETLKEQWAIPVDPVPLKEKLRA